VSYLDPDEEALEALKRGMPAGLAEMLEEDLGMPKELRSRLRGAPPLAQPQFSVPLLLDWPSKPREFALFMDSSAAMVARASAKTRRTRSLTAKYLLRARPEMVRWFEEEFCGQGRPLRKVGDPRRQGRNGWQAWEIVREADIYLASRVLAGHSRTELKASSRRLVNWLNFKHGGAEVWDKFLGLRPAESDALQARAMDAFRPCDWKDQSW